MMGDKTNNLVIAVSFVAGIAIGVAATARYFKTKTELDAEERINRIEEAYQRRLDAKIAEVKHPEEKEKLNAYAEKITDLGYHNYSNSEKKQEKKEEKEETNVPYTISPDDFGDIEDYDTQLLTFYEGDNTLVEDMTDEIIEDVDKLVGKHSLEQFGEYEEDVVYVRNDENETYYEITRDYGKYSETVDQDQEE